MNYKNAIVGQSGGPTAAINASLVGVIRGVYTAEKEEKINALYGMNNGIEGFLSGSLRSLDGLSEADLTLLSQTPASALGSCRKKLPAPETDPAFYEKLFAAFDAHQIGFFFYIGGNDSMDTVKKLSDWAKKIGHPIRVIGVPKTIDNDLVGTDHSPGFGSAAKYIASTVLEISYDIDVYQTKAVTIVEIMGRDAGWLTASSALAGLNGSAPDLIYLPERTFDSERFLSDVKGKLAEKNAVLVCVSEGIRFADGRYVGEAGQTGIADIFGHKYLAGTGKVLENLIREKIGCKVRSIELSLPQRCAGHLSSLTDLKESESVGQAAVNAALCGETGCMLGFVRTSDNPYVCEVASTPIDFSAGNIKYVPDAFINDEGNGVTAACLSYLTPLVIGETPIAVENGLPKYFRFAEGR